MSSDAHATTDEHRQALARPPAKLRVHDVVLHGPRVLLRPLTEDDWAPLLAWNNDPEVLEFAEGDDVRSRTLDEGAAHLALDIRQRALLSHGTRRRAHR